MSQPNPTGREHETVSANVNAERLLALVKEAELTARHSPTQTVPEVLARLLDRAAKYDGHKPDRPPQIGACDHLDFTAQVDITRLTDGDDGPVTGYAADVTVECVGCGEPFTWLGPGGLSPSHPTVSIDGLQLRAPLTPQAAGESILDKIAPAPAGVA